MDVFTAINQRWSVRSYKTTDVEEEKLKKQKRGIFYPTHDYDVLRNFEKGRGN